jgi:hypothetical protein
VPALPGGDKTLGEDVAVLVVTMQSPGPRCLVRSALFVFRRDVGGNLMWVDDHESIRSVI